jgi:hypothetical protein
MTTTPLPDPPDTNPLEPPAPTPDPNPVQPPIPLPPEERTWEKGAPDPEGDS